MENKYNVGEPVCLYATVEGLYRNKKQEIVYNLSYIDAGGQEIILEVLESELTTVF